MTDHFEEDIPERALDLLVQDEEATTGSLPLHLLAIGRVVELLEQDGFEEDPDLVTRVDFH